MNDSESILSLKTLVQEALDELSDLRASVEYDEEYMGDALVFLDQLEQGVTKLYKDIETGVYQLGEGELVFMEIVKTANPSLLPFKELFNRINSIHQQSK